MKRYEEFEFCQHIQCSDLSYGDFGPYCMNHNCKINRFNLWISRHPRNSDGFQKLGTIKEFEVNSCEDFEKNSCEVDPFAGKCGGENCGSEKVVNEKPCAGSVRKKFRFKSCDEKIVDVKPSPAYDPQYGHLIKSCENCRFYHPGQCRLHECCTVASSLCNDWKEIHPKVNIKKPTRSILDEANGVINGERQDSYGKPEDSFKIIADFWAAYLVTLGDVGAVSLSALDVAHMMTLFKIARMMGQKPDRDNYRDAIGYLAIAADRLS